MQSFPINWLALVVVTVIKFGLGFVWFGLVFGKKWQALTGVTEAQMKQGMPKALVTDIVTTFITALVLAHVVHFAGATTWPMGANVGFFCWLGFTGGITLAGNTYEQKPFMHWILGNSYLLLSLVIMGAVLAVWQ